MDTGVSIKRRLRFGNVFSRVTKNYTILVAIAILFVLFSVTSPYFLTYFNIRNIIQQTASVAIVGIGASLIIMSGGFDLSLGMNLCVSSAAAAWLIKFGEWNPWLALCAALVLGLFIGGINGFFCAYVGLPPFIATLATQLVCQGFSKIITNSSPITGFPTSISWIGRKYIGSDEYGIPISVVIMLVLTLLFMFIMRYTKFGRNVMAIGGGAEAAYFAGIDVKKFKVIVYMIGGLMAALGGIVLMTRLDSAAITNGQTYAFDCTIACVMGGISLAGGRGNMMQALLGAIFLTLLFNGMTMLNVNPFVQDVLKGSVLMTAVVIDILRTRYSK